MITLRYLVLALLLVLTTAALAAEPAAGSKTVTLSVDEELVKLIKLVVWGGGTLIAVVAFLGVCFFGWDVRNARASLLAAQKETRELLQELRADFTAMKELKENLEQLGAQLDEFREGGAIAPPPPDARGRKPIDLIREVIRASSYEWTTIGKIIKRTGLTKEAIIEEIQKASDIQIGNGRKTHDFIFKLKNK